MRIALVRVPLRKIRRALAFALIVRLRNVFRSPAPQWTRQSPSGCHDMMTDDAKTLSLPRMRTSP